MKRIFSKNRAIGCLLITNVILVCALFAKEMIQFPVRDWLSKPDKVKAAASPQTAGEVPAATLKMDSEIQACYNGLLAREPEVREGAVVMHWIFNEEGQIDFLKLIQSDLQDPVFLDCLTEKVRRTRMPAADSRAGRLISHKFKFRQRTPDKLQFE